MFKLILVFGVWINPHQVRSLYQTIEGDCNIIFLSGDDAYYETIENKTCDQVAQEINKQMESK